MSVSGARVAIVSLGCRVNRVESDRIADQLVAAGAQIVSEADGADAIVVNTCAVTAEAEAKARKAIRHAASLSGEPVVVATGCAASLFAGEFSSLAKNVLVERDKDRLADVLVKALESREGSFDAVSAASSRAVPVSASMPTPTGRTRPGIKIQDGCDNRCTYCIVWKARGAGRSVDAARVRELVLESLSRGAREVVLTGINLGCYEGTLPDGTAVRLGGLLDWLLSTTDVGRIRLSSIEPPDVTDDLLSVMAASRGRVAPFLHICLQSGCSSTLSRMGRAYDADDYMDVIRRTRSALPDVSLGTDLIVGFPGETDQEFEESLSLCKEAGFSRMHVFRYSRRPGTPAATAPNQVDPRVMAARSARVRALAKEMRAAEAQRRVGTEDLVLVQAAASGVSGGLYDVALAGGRAEQAKPGELVRVRVTGVRDGDTLVASVL